MRHGRAQPCPGSLFLSWYWPGWSPRVVPRRVGAYRPPSHQSPRTQAPDLTRALAAQVRTPRGCYGRGGSRNGAWTRRKPVALSEAKGRSVAQAPSLRSGRQPLDYFWDTFALPFWNNAAYW